jgi:hypothetical protein
LGFARADFALRGGRTADVRPFPLNVPPSSESEGPPC